MRRRPYSPTFDRVCSRLDNRHYPFGPLTAHVLGDLRTGENFHASFKHAMTGVLVSSSFLFRGESQSSTSNVTGAELIGEYELASRLSYFLWNTLPDDELLGAAEGVSRSEGTSKTRRLSDRGVLHVQAERMLNHIRASSRGLPRLQDLGSLS